MEWGFHYSGPREPTQDFNCATCLAKLQGKCPTHGHGFDRSCAHCKAAQGEECQSHWGLEAALEAFAPPKGATEDFELAAKILRDEAIVQGTTNVGVHLHGNRDVARRGFRELHIEITQS